MKKGIIVLLSILLMMSCANDEHELLELNIEEEETSNEISPNVSGEDLLRYFSRNINCSHNHTILIPLGDSMRVLGKDTDVKMSVVDDQIASLFWSTHDWMRSGKVMHDGEEKYLVQMSDLLPNDSEVKKYFPKDYKILRNTKSTDGLKLARERFGKDFYYAGDDGVYLMESNKESYFSKLQFQQMLDSIKENN